MFTAEELAAVLRQHSEGGRAARAMSGTQRASWWSWLGAPSARPREGDVPFVQLLAARALRAPPRRLPELDRFTAWRRVLTGQWGEGASESPRLRAFAWGVSILINLVFAALLLWLMYLRFVGEATPLPDEAIQIEIVGKGSIEGEGGGSPAQAGAVALAGAAAGSNSSRRSSATASPAPALATERLPASAVAVPAAPAPQPMPTVAVQPVLPLEQAPPPTPPAAAPPVPAPPVAEPVRLVSVQLPTARPVALPPLAPRVPALQAPNAVSPPTPPAPVQARTPPAANSAPVAAAPSRAPATPAEPAAPRFAAPAAQAPQLAVRAIEAPALPAADVSIPAAAPRRAATAPSPGTSAAKSAAATPRAAAPASNATIASAAPSPAAAPTAAPRGTAAASAAPASAPGTARGVVATQPGAGAGAGRATGGAPSTLKGDDWGASARNRPGTAQGQSSNGGLYNRDGSVRLAADQFRNKPGDPYRDGSWIRRPSKFEPTRFEVYWRPSETLLAQLFRAGQRFVQVQGPGPGATMICDIMASQGAGLYSCFPNKPNPHQEQPARARAAPDVPFKAQYFEDQSALGTPAVQKPAAGAPPPQDASRP